MTSELSIDRISFPQPGFEKEDGEARLLLGENGRLVSVLESGSLTANFNGAYRPPSEGFNTRVPYVAKIAFSKTYDFAPFFNIMLVAPLTVNAKNSAVYPQTALQLNPGVSGGGGSTRTYYLAASTPSALYVAPNARVTATTDLFRGTFPATLHWTIFDIPWDGVS